MASSESKTVTLGEAAKFLGVSRPTLKLMIEQGQVVAVPAGKRVRISRPSLDRLVNGQPAAIAAA